MFLYLDTSALVKRYAIEKGTVWVRSLFVIEVENAIYLSQIGVVEVAAALSRKVRTKKLEPQEYEEALELFLTDVRNQDFHLLPIDSATTDLAIALTRRHPLRGYDAVHLAAALRLNQVLLENKLAPIGFVSDDQDLCDAASKEGLTVVRPDDSELLAETPDD